MKKPIFIVSAFSLLLVFGVSSSFGYLTEKAINDSYLPAVTTQYLNTPSGGSEHGTHENFTQYTIQNLTFAGGIQNELRAKMPTILAGNKAEDDENMTNALCHFWNPLVSDENQFGLYNTPLCGTSAKIRAIGYYEEAIKSYRINPSNSNSWNKIGRVLHLLQDMAVPAHVHRANHMQHSIRWFNG